MGGCGLTVGTMLGAYLRFWVAEICFFGESVRLWVRYPRVIPVYVMLVVVYVFGATRSGLRRELIAAQRGVEGVSDTELTYGETAAGVLISVLKECEVLGRRGCQDRFLDVGCGKGTLCFVVNAVLGIPCRGIELSPGYVRLGRKVARFLGYSEVQFEQASFLDVSWRGSTIVFVAGTCFVDDTIRMVCRKMASLDCGTVVVSVSYAMPALGWEVVMKRKARFSWGEDWIYVQEKCDV